MMMMDSMDSMDGFGDFPLPCLMTGGLVVSMRKLQKWR